jgi:hypothetical protein
MGLGAVSCVVHSVDSVHIEAYGWLKWETIVIWSQCLAFHQPQQPARQVAISRWQAIGRE